MIDENESDDSGRRPERRPVPLGALARRVPGAAANAPKRNVLVALGYLLACGLLAGLLWAAL
ncbi:hypothetical protein [Halorubrum kocurii]|uniref:Uncharacterized protein n=1 Tax=Halorubrum kocurii JCM 14978 TaxID=1230456 RepID=M0NQ68_9EURY|nr:hypothetical protein [Halorubrum kocurii]EMA60052.1 hypothetical protein C468_13746 [Halorubrum kocurii JCM 14978]